MKYFGSQLLLPHFMMKEYRMERNLRLKLQNGCFKNLTKVRSNTMKAIISRGNRTTEVIFRLALVRYGIRGWVIHPNDVIGHPDFYFPHNKLVIFVDGCFWHGCPKCGHIPKNNKIFWKTKINRNKGRDLKINHNLKIRGFKVIRFWEHDLKGNIDKCIKKVQRY